MNITLKSFKYNGKQRKTSKRGQGKLHQHKLVPGPCQDVWRPCERSEHGEYQNLQYRREGRGKAKDAKAREFYKRFSLRCLRERSQARAKGPSSKSSKNHGNYVFETYGGGNEGSRDREGAPRVTEDDHLEKDLLARAHCATVLVRSKRVNSRGRTRVTDSPRAQGRGKSLQEGATKTLRESPFVRFPCASLAGSRSRSQGHQCHCCFLGLFMSSRTSAYHARTSSDCHLSPC